MALNLKKMNEVDWNNLMPQLLRLYIEDVDGYPSYAPAENGELGQSRWQPRLNDQDVFNAIFTQSPSLASSFNCDWNLQYHGYMNSGRVCQSSEVSLPSNEASSSSYGYNCPNSLSSGMFVCTLPPKVVHFMAGSYRSAGPKGSTSSSLTEDGDEAEDDYFVDFWEVYKKMSKRAIFSALERMNRDLNILV